MGRIDPRRWLARIAGVIDKAGQDDAAQADADIQQAFDLSRWFSGIGSASEEKRASAASTEADARVRAAVDSLPVTLFELDPNGVYTCAAGRYIGLFGISAAQVVGRSAFDFPRFVPGKNIMLRRALTGKAVTFTGIWPLGRFMIRLQPRFDPNGRLTSVVGLGYEIGKPAAADEQIEQLLEALRESEGRFRAMCESAPVGMFVSNSKFELGYVNPALYALLDRKPDELLGRHWEEAVYVEDRERLQGTRDAGNTDDRVLRLVRKGGTRVWASLRTAEMREGGQVLGYVGMVVDISKERELQAQLLVTERLLAVGTLAAGVAHEINNPLAAVIGNLEWVATRLSRLIDPERAELPQASAVLGQLSQFERPLADAREAAQRVRAIVSDLKLFSRAEEDLRGPVELTAVLDSSSRMAWNEVRHRARFVREYAELPAVQGSEARLGQVFLNLIINAAQAIPEGHADEHEIRVSARPLPPDTVVVEVQDTGCGIPADIVGNIFDPFFTTKPAGIGNGLGLAICHRIVTSIGGQIDVESEPGRGSTFRVKLARADCAARANTTASSPPAACNSRGRVLVIDDDPAIADTLNLVLGEDHEVESFTRARGALTRLHAGETYDAIVCDVMMPEMSGIDFHAELAKAQPGLATRVIFLTGGAFTPLARESLDRLPNPRIDKPFDSQQLRTLVNHQVARTRETQRANPTSLLHDLTRSRSG